MSIFCYGYSRSTEKSKVRLRKPVTTPWPKSRSESETVNKQQPADNSQSAERVAKVVGATSSEAF